VAFFVEDYIFRFQVTENNASGMKMLDSYDDFSDVFLALLLREYLLCL